MTTKANYVTTYRLIDNLFNELGPQQLMSVLQTAFSNQWLGVDVPNYKSVIASQHDASSAYSMQVMSVCKPAVIDTSSSLPHSASFSHRHTQTLNFGFDLSDKEDGQIQDIALKIIKNKLKDKSTQFNAIVPVVELRELRGLVRESAAMTLDFLNFVHEWRTGKAFRAIKSPADLRKKAADLWLTYSFGIMPLVSDTQKAAQAVADFLLREDKTTRETGTFGSTYTDSSLFTINGCENVGLDFSTRVLHSLTYQYVAGHVFNISAANNYGVKDHFGLSISQLPTVGYELMPFSWVLDYFTNVGEYLEDRFTTLSGSTVYACLSKKHVIKASAELKSCYSLGNASGYINDGFSVQPAHAEVVYFQRQVLGSLPYRGLQFKTADAIGKNAVNKVLNLASILAK